MLKDWNYTTLNTDVLNLDENKYVFKKNFSMKEKVLRDTQIRSMHEMGEMKRAQERVDDVPIQKLRENHETLQKLISQLQEMQEQMNSMSDSREFISRSGIKLLWEIVLCFQSTCNDSMFSVHAEPRQTPAS